MQVYNQAIRKVIFYETAGGKCPAAEFLDALPGKQAQKVTWVLHLIEELPRCSGQLSEKIGEHR
ncbi:MAG TPA: hypothetical protein VLS45_01880 [Methylomicrobium sp.]|nr:hypothetical protein [Methylomicrobium sp.]